MRTLHISDDFDFTGVETFNGNLTIDSNRFTSFGDLTTIKGDLTILKSNAPSLGKICRVDGDLTITCDVVNEAESLKFVGGRMGARPYLFNENVVLTPSPFSFKVRNKDSEADLIDDLQDRLRDLHFRKKLITVALSSFHPAHKDSLESHLRDALTDMGFNQ